MVMSEPVLSRAIAPPGAPTLSLHEVLSALGNPTRLAVVADVARREPITPGKIKTDVAPATLSRHLAILRRAGIIRQEIEGPCRPCSLRREELAVSFPGLLDCVLRLAGEEVDLDD